MEKLTCNLFPHRLLTVFYTKTLVHIFLTMYLAQHLLQSYIKNTKTTKRIIFTI